jgi:xanthine dehydrogenase YagR molybdenum-binding subunit
MKGHRIEGADMVRGHPILVDDLRVEALGFSPLVAVAVTSAIGSATITRIGSEHALSVPGVKAVLTHENAPRLRKVISLSMSEPGVRLPLQSPRIDYAGQVVALVVAESLQAARDGAARVTVEVSSAATPVIRLEDAGPRMKAVKRAGIGPGKSRKGAADKLLAKSPVTTDDTFHNAPHHQNPIEPGAVNL